MMLWDPGPPCPAPPSRGGMVSPGYHGNLGCWGQPSPALLPHGPSCLYRMCGSVRKSPRAADAPRPGFWAEGLLRLKLGGTGDFSLLHRVVTVGETVMVSARAPMANVTAWGASSMAPEPAGPGSEVGRGTC